MNETDIQAIMIDNKTINQRIENSLNVITAGLISCHMRNIEQAAFRSFTDSELDEFMRLQKKLLNNIDNINTDNLKQKG